MCNLLPCVYLTVYLTCLSLFFCCMHACMFAQQRVHMETGTCLITISLPGATPSSGTQEHFHWIQMHPLREQKTSRPQMWLSVHWSVCTHKRECYWTKEQRKCAEATAAWSPWQQTDHYGEYGWGFRQGIGCRKQALVWWNHADPHSSGLTEDYFGAFWTLPRKHNNFGVSSFIYLLCFPSNEAQERAAYSCFWPLSEGEKEEGCECVCVPECVTVARTIIAFGTFEPCPKAPLQLWLNFHIWNLLQKVCLFCNTTETNPDGVTEFLALHWPKLYVAVIYGYSHIQRRGRGGEGGGVGETPGKQTSLSQPHCRRPRAGL